MTSSVAERNEIVLKLLPRVKKIAGHVKSTLTPNVRREDLVSVGVIGLIQAIDTYSPETGVGLSTYASYRIRGAMLDSVRELDTVSQSQRRTIKKIANATAKAKSVLGREPADYEVASMMLIDVDAFHKLRADVSSVPIIEQIGMSARSAFAPDIQRPDVSFDVAEMKKRLNDAMCRLPDQQEKVLTMLFWMGMSARDIAAVIDVPENKVWKIRRAALNSLRRMCPELAR